MRSIVIRQIPDDVFEWMQAQAKAVILNPEAWLRLKLIEMAREEKMKMKLSDFLRSDSRAWEDDEFMVVKGHSEMHGEPIVSVTDFAHPEAGAKVYRNRDDVEKRLGADRLGEAN